MGSTVSWALGRRGLGEDDGVASLRTVGVDGIAGSRTASGAQRHELGEDNVVVGSGMASWAWGWCLHGRWRHQLRSGKMATCKGARPCSRIMARRLLGGLDNGTGSGEVDDDVGSRKIFS
jgi:hypothetical protein